MTEDTRRTRLEALRDRWKARRTQLRTEVYKQPEHKTLCYARADEVRRCYRELDAILAAPPSLTPETPLSDAEGVAVTLRTIKQRFGPSRLNAVLDLFVAAREESTAPVTTSCGHCLNGDHRNCRGKWKCACHCIPDRWPAVEPLENIAPDVVNFALAWAQMMHENQFDAAVNIDGDDVGHVQPFETCPEKGCRLARQAVAMSERADLAGRLFSKTPHPGMDDPEPDYFPAASREPQPTEPTR